MFNIATLVCLVIVLVLFMYSLRYITKRENLHSGTEADIVLTMPTVFSDRRELGNDYFSKEMGYYHA